MSSGVPFSRADRRDLEQADGAVGAGHDEASVLEADVGLGRLQRVGGERVPLSMISSEARQIAVPPM